MKYKQRHLQIDLKEFLNSNGLIVSSQKIIGANKFFYQNAIKESVKAKLAVERFIGESPISTLSYQQLTLKPNALLVATMGSISKEKANRINKIFKENPQAKITLGFDNDTQGLLNTMNIFYGLQDIQPHIYYDKQNKNYVQLPPNGIKKHGMKMISHRFVEMHSTTQE